MENMTQNIENRYCNCCGRKIAIKGDLYQEDFLSVKKEWGYFSSKDGEIHQFTLCENCYDTVVKGFVIPVSKEEKKEMI